MTTIVSEKSNSIKKRRTKSSTTNKKNKENRITKDSELEFAIETLQNAIDFTDDILMDNSSDEDW